MYSPLQLGIKYLRYQLTAANGKGHGMHSPFVFEFIVAVLNDKSAYYCYGPIELLRTTLKQSALELEIEDFGAGSRVNTAYKRKVSDIARSASKPAKFAQLLFRMVNFYQPANILELGTSLGITTAYLASANNTIPVTTMEGAAAVAKQATENFKKLSLHNIHQVQGNFDDTLPGVLHQMQQVDFAFIDGNHRKVPTIRYFEQMLPFIQENSVLIFDDVHWSREMEAAWEYIKKHSAVTLSVDLFFIGIIFFRKEQKIKQDFTIRF